MITGGAGGTNAGNGGSANNGANATPANRGCGGGGDGFNDIGGNGSSGRVIIRYLTADATGFTVSASGATSATPTADGSYSYFQFDATGSLTVA